MKKTKHTDEMKDVEEVLEEKPKKRVEQEHSEVNNKYVVQIRKALPNKQYENSVTKFIGEDKAKHIYEMLEEE